MTTRRAVTIPAPAAPLTANERLHWAARADRTRLWRHAATIHTRKARLPVLDRAHILVTAHPPDRRRRDVANLHPTVKIIVDGIVDAGILPSDDDEHLVGPDLRAGPVNPSGWLFVVTITELEVTA